MPRQVLQTTGCDPGLAPLPAAGRARLQPRDHDLFLDAAGRLLEADLEIVAEVRPAMRASRGPTLPPAEKPFEDIVEDAAEARDRNPRNPPRLAQAGGAEAIVGLSLFSVAQNRVGLADLLESLFRRRVAGILVRVVRVGELRGRPS